MELQKIYTDSDFSNAVIPEGSILTYLAQDDEGNIVTKTKNSSGEIGVIAGGESGESVIPGYFINNADGTLSFQPLEGTTEAVAQVSIVNTGVTEPDYSAVVIGTDTSDATATAEDIAEGKTAYIASGKATGTAVFSSSMDFYKCASVDTANKTWSGYLAVLTDGVYTFEETVTTGLTYGTAFTPKQSGIYTADAAVQASRLWSGLPTDYTLSASLASTSVETGQEVTQEGGEFTIIDGVSCYSSNNNTLRFSNVTLDASTGMTYAIRIYPRTLSGWQDYVTLKSSEQQFNLWGLEGQIGMWYTSSSLWSPVVLPATNKWYHCALTYIDGIVCFYLDGVKYSSPTSMNFGDVTECLIGLNEDPCDCAFADFKIYDRSLSDEEILTLV